MITDTHAHLDFPDFEADLDNIVARAAEAGVQRIVTIGTSIEGSERAIGVADRYPNVWAVVGVHPNSADEAPDDVIEPLRKLASHPKVVAIGETGLDYFRLPGTRQDKPADAEAQDAVIKAAQARVFQQQLTLASELGLNVVIHERAAWDDTIAILRPYSGKLRAVFHCFGAGPSQLQEVLDLGHLVSFTGIITFKNAAQAQESASLVPADRFMVETDCPFLAPVPHRGSRCEPAYVRHTAEKLAALRGTSLEVIARDAETTANGFFRFTR